MKKFLSMVMAAAMVVSLVPATAFAADDSIKATASVVDAKNYTQDEIETALSKQVSGPELQLYFTTAKYTSPATPVVKDEYTVTLDNAEFDTTAFGSIAGGVGTLGQKIYITADGTTYTVAPGGRFTPDGNAATGGNELKDMNDNQVKITDLSFNSDKDEMTFTVEGKMDKGWTLAIALDSEMDKTSKGKTATVSVEADEAVITNADDLVYASVEAKGIKASVKDTVDIAVEEVAKLKEIKIEPTVGSTFAAITDTGKELSLRLPSGYEFASNTNVKVNGNPVTNVVDDDEITITVNSTMKAAKEWKVTGLYVEATSAKAGSVGTVRIGLTGSDTVTVEAIKVVDYAVTMSVDEDEDVPVMYSGVDADNTGITDDSDHKSLEVTVKETFVGAFDEKKDLTFTLPEGVYIAETNTSTPEGVDSDGTDFLSETNFVAAYKEGEHSSLVFKRRTMQENTGTEAYEANFTLTLVADPNFEGDVVLTMEGDAVEKQEVTIAKFVKPYTVEAQQNDMQIDYRNTEIPTSVVIKEAEAGLWDDVTDFQLALDKIEFDVDAKVTVDDKSGLEIKNVKTKGGVVSFEVDEKSDDEPATVTISGLELYMDRSLPAGAYDLKVASEEMLGINVLSSNYDEDDDVVLVTPRATGYLNEEVYAPKGNDNTIADVNDDSVSYTAKAGFVNIVTAGREDTDSFTTKVVVPVGESYLISGENKVTIDVPAYINANGYTMLPLRAVAVALGINANNVLWDQASRTATVMYGSKIINMTYGQKVVYVNGAMIPATAAVEITNDRMFLGLRDLGTALGVTDITWDGATKTATLNGNK
ncbi:copper amine oxidase N-terminal domain-containing protein [Anaerotignum lactatifermentans]|uniref:copper amine oxidase N-terminal domain-containing protein n=1 Tax=Anaerotignum lactatifermentans TaxID=160404 RepID=UPI003AB1CBBD